MKRLVEEVRSLYILLQSKNHPDFTSRENRVAHLGKFAAALELKTPEKWSDLKEDQVALYLMILKLELRQWNRMSDDSREVFCRLPRSNRIGGVLLTLNPHTVDGVNMEIK